MTSIVFCCALFLACTLTSAAAQSSCTGRCGDGYDRGSTCQCDYNCIGYGECCRDFESLCTTKKSCKGRCGEGFRRGRMCSCDLDCVKYKQCCPDYQEHCVKDDDLADPTAYPQDDPEVAKADPATTEGPSEPPTTEPYTSEVTPDATTQVTDTTSITLLPEITTAEITTSEPPTNATTEDQTSLSSSAAPYVSEVTQGFITETSTETFVTSSTTQMPEETSNSTTELTDATMTPSSPSTIPEVTTVETTPDATTASSSPSTTPEVTTVEITPDATTASSSPSTTPEVTTVETKPTEPPKPDLDKPLPEPETNPGEYQADDSNDVNLCNGRPITGVTTLRNGTVVVFRGQNFWFLDPNRVPGPARDITQTWGVPSPIDTVFTRCNCQGKTYIFKGGKYWRFENDALDPGYPKVVETGFDGLRGPITAALSIPQHRSRREAVYFFKRGGTVQKYSYQSGTSPTCGRKPQFAIHTVQHRHARQAVSVLGVAINFRTNWRGFPPTVTSAVSVPSSREPDGYKYYVFSGSKSYNVRMDVDRPVMETPKAVSFVKCPNSV